MPLDPNQIAFAKDLLKMLRESESRIVAYTPKIVIPNLSDAYNSAAKDARKSMALEIIHLIEARAPESELWTSSPDANAVTSESRLGDHLYITRKHFGIPV